MRREGDGLAAPPTQALHGHGNKVYLVDAQAQLRPHTGSLPAVDALDSVQ